MASDVQIREMTAQSTGVDKTSGTVRFKSADNTTVDTNDRISIPVAGTTYSYTKQLRFYFNTAPSVDIQNLRAYADGTNNFGTGVSVNADNTNAFGTNFNTNMGGTELFANYTSGTPLDLDTTNAGPHTGTGFKGDFMRLQMGVASTASPGQLSSEQITFAYDET